MRACFNLYKDSLPRYQDLAKQKTTSILVDSMHANLNITTKFLEQCDDLTCNLRNLKV